MIGPATGEFPERAFVRLLHGQRKFDALFSPEHNGFDPLAWLVILQEVTDQFPLGDMV